MPQLVNIRIGGGFIGSDTSVNTLAWGLKNAFHGNWNTKLDILYKFYRLERDYDGKWMKAHALGLFLTGGNQTGANLNRLFPANSKPTLDAKWNNNPFFEAECGIMLSEEFRISGGGGFTKWTSTIGDISTVNNQTYFTVTTGLSPRLFSFLELDLLVSGVLINKEIRPRATINAVLLIKTWKR